MLNSKTVFILGAGASKEVGFPLGSELKTIISNKLNLKIENIERRSSKGDIRVIRMLNIKYQSILINYIQLCQQIKDGIIHSASIDEFIDQHNHDERIAICGKLAIACSILDAEKESYLCVDSNNKYNTINFDEKVENTWYTKFYSLLTTQLSKPDIENVFNNITVINFNYDRSLEHFLIHKLINNYLIEKEQARQIVNKLVMYRPYGSIDKSVDFGADELPGFDNIISNLKTYTEKVADTEELNKIKKSIIDSKVIIFLGNDYHEINMNLLKCECRITGKKLYATRKGITDNDIDVVKRRILLMDSTEYADRIQDNFIKSTTVKFDSSCNDLFNNYRLSLSEL